MSLFERFTSNAKLCEQTEFVSIYRVRIEEKEYKILLTKRRANHHTVIHCEHNRILWEQVPLFPRFAGKNYGDKIPIFSAIPEKTCVTIFVVKGKLNGFVGLDEGVFRCAHNWDDDCIHVMSYKQFTRM